MSHLDKIVQHICSHDGRTSSRVTIKYSKIGKRQWILTLQYNINKIQLSIIGKQWIVTNLTIEDIADAEDFSCQNMYKKYFGNTDSMICATICSMLWVLFLSLWPDLLLLLCPRESCSTLSSACHSIGFYLCLCFGQKTCQLWIDLHSTLTSLH